MLASVIATQIRQMTSDEFAPYRNSDAEILVAIGDALVSLNSVHPEAFMLTDIPVDPPTAPALLTTDIDLDPVYKMAVVYYACSQLFLQDSESAGNLALSQEHMNRYKGEI